MNMNAPAIFLGIQPGFNHLPTIELYNLLAKVGHHPAGSTVSRKTLEDHGYVPPAFSASQPNLVKAAKSRR
jgi:hypothetical protein